MGRAPCCDKANVKKGPWSPEEDTTLKDYIDKYGTGGNWIALPQKIGLKRCGKSCRLRWLNYLRPNIRHGSFSEEEDEIICSLYVSIGSRWSIIAAQLPGRTDNDIKNYWNTRLKKKLIGKQRKQQQQQQAARSEIKQEIITTMKTQTDHHHPLIYPQHMNQALYWPVPPHVHHEGLFCVPGSGKFSVEDENLTNQIANMNFENPFGQDYHRRRHHHQGVNSFSYPNQENGTCNMGMMNNYNVSMEQQGMVVHQGLNHDHKSVDGGLTVDDYWYEMWSSGNVASNSVGSTASTSTTTVAGVGGSWEWEDISSLLYPSSVNGGNISCYEYPNYFGLQ